MEENSFILDLLGALHQSKSNKQINEDIKQLEKTINMLRITGTFARGNTKQELNAYIKSLQAQLNHIKLNAKIDDKNLKREIEGALNKLSFKDIDLLKFDGSKTKLKMQKVIADTKAYVEKNPVNIGINYEIRRNKLDNDLTAYLKRNTKIEESSVLLKEADRVRTLIGAINDKKSLREATDAFQLYKSSVASVGFNTKSTTDKIKDMFSHITKLGSIFSVTSLAVNNFTKSLGTLKNIDDILTEISKTSDLTARELERLGSVSFESASKYGKTASDYLLGIQEMSRSGFYGDKGAAMAEQSLLAQAAGDMGADVANKYILATNAAYKYNGEAEKLNAVLDGQNSITNRNSVALSDMAVAMSEAGTVASSYRVSIEDLSAMIGTMQSVTQLGGSEVGNGIKAILINLQNVTSDKIVDTLNAANASMTEFVNGTEKLRDPISILRDLAKTFNQLDEDDALRAEILTNIGGKHQASKLAALLQNMKMFDKMLIDYSEGSGSAMEEAMKSANNWSGKVNRLQNSWNSLVASITNKNAVLSGLSFGDKLIQGAESFINTFGEIPVILTTINTAMTAMKKDYGITQFVNPETKKIDIQGNLFGIDFTAIKEQKKHFEDAQTAMHLWNDAMSNGENDLDSFNNTLVNNNAQLKEYLSTCSKDAPASLNGYRKYLESTGQATEGLRLKTILLNSAITMGVGIAIQLAVKALDNYIHRLDNAKEALSSELSSVNDEIKDTTDKIAALEALDPSSLSITDKEDLQRLKDQNEELRIRQKYLEQQEKYDLQKVADLTKEKYGQKYGNVNSDTVDEYRSLYSNKDTKTFPASSYLTGETSSQSTPYAASKQSTDVMRGSGTLADLIAQYEYYLKLKKEAVQSNDAEGIKQYEDKLTEIANKLRDDRTELQEFSDDLKAAGDTSDELDNITWQLKAIDDLLLSPGQNLVNFLDKDILTEDKQKLVDLANVSKLTQDELSTNFSEVDKYLKENGLTLEDLISVVKTYKEEISDVSDTDLTPSINMNGVISGIETQVKPVMDAIQSAWADAYDDEGVFKIDPSKALDAVNQVKSAIDSINSEEGLGIQIDTSSIEELANVLTDTSATEEDVRQAYSNIADAVMNEFLPAMDGMDDAHIRVMQTFLEGLGIMNAEELIIQQLGYSYDTYTAAKRVAAQAGIDLANATVEDVMKFAEESTAAEEDKIALLDYYQYKIIASGATIDTSGSIAQLLAEYEQLGINCEKLKEYLGLHGAGAGSKVDLKHKGYSSSTEGYDTGANTKPKLPEIPKGIDDRRAKAAKAASKAEKEEADVMSELNSEMDKLQSFYKSLCDIKDTYNKYGQITVDQYQELTNMGFNFLAQLVDENGQLGLNASAFERLAQAKLEEMQIQMARNATDTINGLKTETEAVEYLTYANEKLRDAALGAAEAQLESAVAAAKMRGEQQGAAAEQIYKGYQASKQMAGNVDFFFDPSALEKEEKEKQKAEKEDKTDKLLEAYNKEKAVLEHMLAMDQISKSEYYERLMALVKQYFEGDPEHQDQIWDVEESYHDYLESIKETYNWIEIFLDNLAKKANALIDKASKFISWSKKNAMINRAVKATDKQITGQTNAYAYYAEKARKVGLNNSYIDKIQNGTLTMEDMQNESLSGKIEKYQEWYDKMVACEDAIGELYDQERDLIKQKLDNVLEYYNDLDSYMSSIVSKMDSFISLMDDMGKRSSLTDLLEQFAAANEQIAYFQSQTTTKKENEKDYFDNSKKVEAAKKKDTDELLGTLNTEKEQISTGVQNTGTYKKLLKDIAKAELEYDKQYDKLWAIDPEKDKNGKKAEAAQKKLDQLGEKLDALVNKKDDLEANATANNIVEYSKIYDQYMKLYNKREQLEAKGKELSAKDTAKLESLFDQMVEMGKQRDDAIKELENQIGIADGSKKDSTEAENLKKQIQAIDDGVKNSATYQNLEKDIDAVQAKIDKFWDTHDSATKAQQKQLDQWEAQLEAYYEKQKQLEENATADTVGEYAKVYDAWRKLQDKLDAGKVLSVAEYKNYNKYNDQLKQFAEERSSIIKSLEDQLEKALDPGDKVANINREYEEAAEGIYKSYQDQIDNIDARMKVAKQYQDLLAKKQNLENIRDTKGLSASQEKTLKKYTEELEALEKGGTGDNIANYIKTWEQWYALQQKIDSGKKLSSSEASKYDSLKSQLEAWNKEKQTQISDLIDLMNDDLEKLREKNAENIAEAESEINNYYSKVYELAKQIAEYNINALKEQLAYLDAYISYYKDLVSLYDQFSGDKLSKLLTDLDEGAFNDQIQVYEKYLATLQSKYDATLSEINEYKQLIDAIDTNDFEASMDLFQKAMDNYKATGNTEMADKLQSVLKLLNDRAVDADNWDEFADLWMNEWEQALAESKSGLIETAGAIQEINDALREVRFSNITDALEELTRASNILSSMSNLIQDTWLYEGEGLSEYGKAKVALLVSQLENAQGAANEYLELVKKIQDNEDTYASDKAYQDALAEATQNYYDSLSNAADIENTIVDIMKKAQEEEVSNWKDIISARKEALAARKAYYDYSRNIKDKNKNIEALKAERAAIEDVTTAEAKARKAKLDAQIKEAEDDLTDTKIEHEYSMQEQTLSDWLAKLESQLDDSNKTVQESLESQKKIIEEAKELYQTSTDSVNETMDKIVKFYSGMGMSIDGIDLTPNGSNISGADEHAGLSVNVGGSMTEQMGESVKALIEAVKNESSEIQSKLEQPEFKERLVSMMSDRIVPDLGGVLASVNRMENYQVNGGDNKPVEINVHYDALLNVEGNVDEKAAKLLPQQLEQSFDYTTKKLYNQFTHLGLHVKSIGR